MEILLLLLRALPTLLEIVKMIQRGRLTAQATDEMLADLEMTAEYLVSRSNLARAEVKDTDEAVLADEFNRDRR